MKLVICAGSATTGKTSVLRQMTRKLVAAGNKLAFLKIDVQYADEDDVFAREFSMPTRKVYSGELCPDHCSVLVLGDAMKWAGDSGADILIVETAGLCLRCAPYVDGGLGMMVMEATSGMNLPRKVGPMLSLADIAVVTKIDLVSQAEREVFRARILEAAPNFLLSQDRARKIMDDQIAAIHANWDAVCDEAGLSQVDRALLWGWQFLNPFALQGFAES